LSRRCCLILTHKHLLGIEHISAAGITTIMETEDSFFKVSIKEIKKATALCGKTMIDLFYEALLLGGTKE